LSYLTRYLFEVSLETRATCDTEFPLYKPNPSLISYIPYILHSPIFPYFSRFSGWLFFEAGTGKSVACKCLQFSCADVIKTIWLQNKLHIASNWEEGQIGKKAKNWKCDWRMENGIGIFGRARDTGEMLEEEKCRAPNRNANGKCLIESPVWIDFGHRQPAVKGNSSEFHREENWILAHVRVISPFKVLLLLIRLSILWVHTLRMSDIRVLLIIFGYQPMG